MFFIYYRKRFIFYCHVPKGPLSSPMLVDPTGVHFRWIIFFFLVIGYIDFSKYDLLDRRDNYNHFFKYKNWLLLFIINIISKYLLINHPIEDHFNYSFWVWFKFRLLGSQWIPSIRFNFFLIYLVWYIISLFFHSRMKNIYLSFLKKTYLYNEK